jgi:large subunit ribosomal protein L10
MIQRRAGRGKEGKTDLNRREKEAAVDELRKMLERSKAAILTDYRGLKVTEITELRHKLKEAGVEYRVVKNSLTRLALQGTPALALKDHLTGPNALAYSFEDELTPARLLLDYAKGNDKLQVKAGVLAGRLILQEEMKRIVNLPSKEELQAQLLGIMSTLPSRLLGVMNAVPRDFVGLLAAAPSNFLALLRAIEQKGTPASLSE